MSYRTPYLSPIHGATTGLGTMPGKTSGTALYSSSYGSSSTRLGSAGKYNTITGAPSSHYTPSRRPLPAGPGPLDSRGRKISDTSLRSNSSATRNGPLKADHTFGTDSKYTASIGTLPRRYNLSSNNQGSGSSTTNDISSRHVRSRSVSNVHRTSENSADRLSNNLSNLQLTSHERVKPSPRTLGYDDAVGTRDRESRRDTHDYGESGRAGSRSSRMTNGSIYGTDDFNSSRNRENISRGTSLTRDLDNSRRRDSITDSQAVQGSKSLSRQSSSSSLSTGSSHKYTYAGQVGLRNIGNTCFMNSIIQCLSNISPLLEYCLKEDYVMDKNKTTSKLKGGLIVAYVSLMTSFWKEKSTTYVSPNSFKSQIQKFAPRFTGYQQQDAQEFLRYLLEGLHEDVNRITQKPKHQQIDDEKFSSDSEKALEYWNNYLRYDHSRVVEIFVGQLKSELKFDNCGHRSVTFDPFWDLSLPVSRTRSECDILDCLGLFMKEERLDGDESPRFSQERYSRKITTLVNFPISNLDFSEFAAEKVNTPEPHMADITQPSVNTRTPGNGTALMILNRVS
ncbi:UBP2-like protein [Mya arenaria]|uniref:ubiquitinyl hydrolase 1 n=1 Tax=Mya arenaria TaxID=6604 RepID=A0ABY7E8G7_MYAAR|nr:UBP2-like protein [Mya arenaria]